MAPKRDRKKEEEKGRRRKRRKQGEDEEKEEEEEDGGSRRHKRGQGGSQKGPGEFLQKKKNSRKLFYVPKSKSELLSENKPSKESFSFSFPSTTGASATGVGSCFSGVFSFSEFLD
jgi:hypothetical protein